MRSRPSTVAAICLALMLAIGLPWLTGCAAAADIPDVSATQTDCDGCDQDGTPMSCDALSCGSPALVAPAGEGVSAPGALVVDGQRPAQPIQARSVGPEPFPPRIAATA